MSEQPAFLPDEHGRFYQPECRAFRKQIIAPITLIDHPQVIGRAHKSGVILCLEEGSPLRTYPALVTSKRDRTHRLWPWLLLAVPVAVAAVWRLL